MASSRILLLAFLAAASARVATCMDSSTAAGSNLPLPVQAGKIESVRVGETREFWVSLPDGYNDSTLRFPVVYMMDGDFNFNSGGIGALRHSAQMGEIPDFIIVGVKNTDRSKDIFPEEVSYPDGSKDGGRANQYLDFVREELIPHVERTYRTGSYRVLYGTSNTGFTAVYALFRNPGTADAYVAASATLSIPSFRKDREDLVRDFKGGKRRLSLVMGEHDLPTVISQNGALKEAIDSLAPAGLSCRLAVIRGAEHVPASSLIEGLRGLFDGWRVTQRLTESSFSEIRTQVDGRLAKFGVPGNLQEDVLKDLGGALVAEKKFGKAVEVLQYRVHCYPRSADAQVALGDAYRLDDKKESAGDCYRKALFLAPDHPVAASRLKQLP
jgi:predicted alpha/beta superfamily hydrolase